DLEQAPAQGWGRRLLGESRELADVAWPPAVVIRLYQAGYQQVPGMEATFAPQEQGLARRPLGKQRLELGGRERGRAGQHEIVAGADELEGGAEEVGDFAEDYRRRRTTWFGRVEHADTGAKHDFAAVANGLALAQDNHVDQ